ncbi:hypothetical protein BVG19_g2282 [[Candida] boidinii]|nr:hypothetical protein BVG19_g2282 [[Candida] boidinii]OWB52086.1 hypothetical protein B5S27_g3658 [[Candida] boidinii]
MSELPTHSRSKIQSKHSKILKAHKGNKISLPKSDISLLDIPDSIKQQLNIPLSTSNFKLCIKSFLTFKTALELNLLDSIPKTDGNNGHANDGNSDIDDIGNTQQQFIYIHDDSLIKPFENFGDSNDNLIGYIAQVFCDSKTENLSINSDYMDTDTDTLEVPEFSENAHYYSSTSMLIPFADNLWTLIKLNQQNLNEIPILESSPMSIKKDPLTFHNDEFKVSDISQSSNLLLTSLEFEQLNELFGNTETNNEFTISKDSTTDKDKNTDQITHTKLTENFDHLINASNNTELYILKYFQNIYGLPTPDKPNDIFQYFKKKSNNHNTEYTSILFNLFISNLLSFESKIYNNIQSNDLPQIYSNLPVEYMDKLIKVNNQLMATITDSLRNGNDSSISNESGIQSEFEIDNKISMKLNEIKLNEIKFQILINFELLSLLKFDNNSNEIDKPEPIKSKNTKIKRKLVGRKKGLVPTILGTVAVPITQTATATSSSTTSTASTATLNDQVHNKTVSGVGLTIGSITKQLLTDNINLFFDKLCLIDVLNSISLNNPNSSYNFLIESIYKNPKYYKNHSKLIKSLVDKLRGPSLNSRKKNSTSSTSSKSSSASSSSSKKRLNLENYSNPESNLNDLNLNILEKEQKESLLSSLESNINPFKKNSSLLKSGISSTLSFSDLTGSLSESINGITPSNPVSSNSRPSSISGSFSMNSVLSGNGITSTMTSLQKNLFERKSFEMIKNTSFQNLSQANELDNDNSLEATNNNEDRESLFLGNKNKKSQSMVKRSLKASHSSSSNITSKKNKRQLVENSSISIPNEDSKKIETLIQATPIKKQKYKSKEMMMSIGSSPSVGFSDVNRNIQQIDEIANAPINNHSLNDGRILSVLESPVMLRSSHSSNKTTTSKRPKRAEIVSSSPFKLDTVQTTSTNGLISTASVNDESGNFKDPNNTIPASITTNSAASSILLSPIIRTNNSRRDSRSAIYHEKTPSFPIGSVTSASSSGITSYNESGVINDKNISIINSSPINENGVTLLDDSPNKTNRKLQFS